MESTRGLSLDTIRTYSSRAETFLKWMGTRHKSLSLVSLSDVDAFLAEKASRCIESAQAHCARVCRLLTRTSDTTLRLTRDSVNQALVATLMLDTFAIQVADRTWLMNNEQRPGQPRADIRVEFFLKLIGAFLKKVMHALLWWLFHALP